MSGVRACSKCNKTLSLTRENFGSGTKPGTFKTVCRVCIRAAVALHHKQNPHMLLARIARRKEQEKRVGVISEKNETREIERLRRLQRDCCFYCSRALDGTGELDHKTPIAKGGSNTPENFALACLLCNKEKHAKTVPEYRTWLRDRGRPYAF